MEGKEQKQAVDAINLEQSELYISDIYKQLCKFYDDRD